VTGAANGPDVVSTGSTGSTGSTDEVRPFLRVVRGDPTPEELAALVGVLASLGGPAAAPARGTPEWNAPRRLHRPTHPHGPGGWRASALPH
jgi:hypothetical protein